MRKEQWRNTTAVYTYKPTDLCAVTPTERRKKEPTWRQLTPKCLWHHSTNPKLTGNKFREQAAGSEAFEGFLFSGKTFTTKRKEGSDWTRELQVHRGNRNSPMQSFQRCVLQCCQARCSWRPRWWCCGSGRRLWSPRWRPSESWSEPAGSSPPWALRRRHRWERVSDRVTEGGASECMSGGWFESSAVSRAAGFKSDDSLFTLKLCPVMRDAHFAHRRREAAVTFRPSAQQEVHVFCFHPTARILRTGDYFSGGHESKVVVLCCQNKSNKSLTTKE